jgi:hypothetical protein
MNVLKTALVSTISLGIAMSVAALFTGPSLAVIIPRLPITGKQACAPTTIPISTTAGTPTNVGITIDFTLGVAKPVALIFSSDVATAPTATSVTLAYAIDGATVPTPLGPTMFTDDFLLTTRTAYAVTGSLSKGKHTITPFLTAVAGTGTAGPRCFTVLNTGA